MYEVYGGLLKEDIIITINGKKVCCPPESTILEAARGAGIDIPTLCYLKGLTPTGACGICAVEIEEDGERIIRRSCRVRAKDGMVIYTNTPAVIEFHFINSDFLYFVTYSDTTTASDTFVHITDHCRTGII